MPPPPPTNPVTPPSDRYIAASTFSKTASGYVLGGGLEYAFWNNLTARVEYSYARFDSEAFPFTTGTQRTLRDTTTNTWRVGLTYKFGGDWWGKGPFAVKY